MVLFVAVTIALWPLWFGDKSSTDPERLFQGRPEREWIASIESVEDKEIRQWRAFGEEGIQVLVRGLKRANDASGRTYRKFNEALPPFLRRVLPTPRSDSTRSTRACLVALLSRLGDDAKSAAPIMIWMANNEELPNIRQEAIAYFITAAGDNTLANQLPANQKKELLPALIRAIQDTNDVGQRHNASILIKYFPEHREAVAPILVKAMHDPEMYVRLYAAEALNRVAPDDAMEAAATSMLADAARTEEPRYASVAVTALGHPGSQPELAVPALVECLQSTNSIIACEAIWALEWAPSEFHAYSNSVVPALRQACSLEGIGGYAKAALAKWEIRPKAKDPVREQH